MQEQQTCEGVGGAVCDPTVEGLTIENAIGRAFMCADGVVRWVTHVSKRKFLHILWLGDGSDEWCEGGTWENGGRMLLEHWTRAPGRPVQEVRAPQPGEEFRLRGMYGHVLTMVMNQRRAG